MRCGSASFSHCFCLNRGRCFSSHSSVEFRWHLRKSTQSYFLHIFPTTNKTNAKAYYTCIAQSATSRIPQLQRRCSCHRQSWRRPYAKPAATDWPTTNQPYAALVCRLMVSTSVIHNYITLITWITIFITDPGWMEGWVGLVGWPIADTGHTKKWSHVNHRSGVDQGKSTSPRPTSRPRRQQ